MEQERTWTKEQREDIRQMKAFEELVSNKAFLEYQRQLNKNANHFQNMLIAPSEGIGDVLKTEYAKGAVAAFITARDLPQTIIQAVRQDLGLNPDEEIE